MSRVPSVAPRDGNYVCELLMAAPVRVSVSIKLATVAAGMGGILPARRDGRNGLAQHVVHWFAG